MSTAQNAVAIVLFAASAAACAPPTPVDDAGAADGGSGGDAGPRDGGFIGDAGAIANEWGFAMRVPQSRALPCADEGMCPDGTYNAPDVDHVCTLSVGGHDAVVYVAATPTGIGGTFFPLPIYDDVHAYLVEGGGAVVALTDAAYDYGGNHHNDFFSVVVEGARYTWDHSSYGFGFRACQEPDCVKIEADGGLVDGCQPTRTLAEACILVAEPLPPLVDDFETCPGDDP